MSGRIPLRRHVLARLRRLTVSNADTAVTRLLVSSWIFGADDSSWKRAAILCFQYRLRVFCSNASRPNKPVQKSLDKLFVKGSAQLIAQAKRLGEERSHRDHTRVSERKDGTSRALRVVFAAVQSGEVSGCSKEFRSLMSMPTPGALQLKQHLTQGGQTGVSSGSSR